MQKHFGFALILCGVLLGACSSSKGSSGSSPGGQSATSSSSSQAGSGGASSSRTGGSSASAGRAGGSSSVGDSSSSAGGSDSGGSSGDGGSSSSSSSESSGGSTSVSSGGTTGGGGSSSSSSSSAPPCANGVQDPGETGIDCGGSCPACPIVYKVNPPNQCQNRYFYSQCKKGDASTECGGVCQPRNACENASSKDGAIGFACSRYMMFSPAMSQAAKDDGAANGWDAENPPFLYAVAGHDTNKDGIDKGMAGYQPCCECYQLIFEQPFNEGGASNQAPPPKPLIVQSFNIGATTESFDLYMGMGGFGAFNGCLEGTIKSSAGNAQYDGYPADGQPGNGGVKFRSYDECKSGNEKISNAEAIGSATCQDKIAGLCGEVKSTKSAELQSTTKDSCIKSNQVGTLYHQNWAVYAKRVECPENLTRVTGCKLAPEAGLAKVDAKVTTVEQAKAAGFLSGYHTTTMQDCCKPACSWVEKVGGDEGQKKVDAQFTNFYTCDANDKPMTE